MIGKIWKFLVFVFGLIKCNKQNKLWLFLLIRVRKTRFLKKLFLLFTILLFQKCAMSGCIYSIECELWHCTKSAKNKINIRAKLSLNPANYHFFLFLFYFRLLLKMVNTKAPFFQKLLFRSSHRRCSIKKLFFFPPNSRENTWVGVFLKY